MKEIDGWVKMKKYTDDDGRPVCGGCLMLYDSGERYECDFEGVGIYPGQTCPIWHGESEIESLLRDAARYRWLREHASPGLFSTAFAAVGLYSWKTPSQIDEGVDAAMKIYPPQEK